MAGDVLAAGPLDRKAPREAGLPKARQQLASNGAPGPQPVSSARVLWLCPLAVGSVSLIMSLSPCCRGSEKEGAGAR